MEHTPQKKQAAPLDLHLLFADLNVREKIISQQISLEDVKESVKALGLKSVKSLGSFVGLTENKEKPLSLWKETWTRRVKSGQMGMSVKFQSENSSPDPINQIEDALSQLGRMESSLSCNELSSSLENLALLEDIQKDISEELVYPSKAVKNQSMYKAEDEGRKEQEEFDNLITKLKCHPIETCPFVSCATSLHKSSQYMYSHVDSHQDNDMYNLTRRKSNQKCASLTKANEKKDVHSFESLEELHKAQEDESSHYVYGKEALQHYRLFRNIEKRKLRETCSAKTKKAIDKLEWQLQMLDQLIDVGKEYFFNPRGTAAEKWCDLQNNVKEKCNCQLPVEDQLGRLPIFYPYFTYFIVIVQILTFIVVCALGGVTTVGFEPQILTRGNIKTFLGLETAHKLLVPNPWIGPSSSAFIGLGALFAPCMREDYTLNLETVRKNYSLEEPLGCCEIFARNTAGTTTEQECELFTDGVGQWREGVTCSERASGNNSIEHVIKPCCVGIKGFCFMMSHHHCAFLEGKYYRKGPEHCRQVKCLNQVCGMGGLAYSQERPWIVLSPNQWWRILLSLIYNQGILQLLCVIFGHLLLTRRIEPIAGWLRAAIIYLVSGVIGVLGGAVFSPYEPHFGTVGALFGMVGVALVESIQSWKLVKKPVKEFAKIVIIILVCFLCGTLPFLSNFQLLFSLLSGIITAVMILPYVTFGHWNQHCRKVLVGISVPFLKLVFIFIVYLFYRVQDLTYCQSCNTFECIPYTNQFCSTGY